MRCAACDAILSLQEEQWNLILDELETLCFNCQYIQTDDPFLNFLKELTSEGQEDEKITTKKCIP